jgi:hypothetical protein
MWRRTLSLSFLSLLGLTKPSAACVGDDCIVRIDKLMTSIMEKDITSVSINITYISLSFVEIKELNEQILTESVSENWSNSSVDVAWTDDCQVSLIANIELPKPSPDVDIVKINKYNLDNITNAFFANELFAVSSWALYGELVSKNNCEMSDTQLQSWKNSLDRVIKLRTAFFQPTFGDLLEPVIRDTY